MIVTGKESARSDGPPDDVRRWGKGAQVRSGGGGGRLNKGGGERERAGSAREDGSDEKRLAAEEPHWESPRDSNNRSPLSKGHHSGRGQLVGHLYCLSLSQIQRRIKLGKADGAWIRSNFVREGYCAASRGTQKISKLNFFFGRLRKPPTRGLAPPTRLDFFIYGQSPRVSCTEALLSCSPRQISKKNYHRSHRRSDPSSNRRCCPAFRRLSCPH